MSVVTPLLWTLPWVLTPLAALARAANSRSLEDVPAEAPHDAPRVSVIVPARNEARNIERCARSILSSRYPDFEVIVVDDHSSDGTGALARSIAQSDPRLRVVDAPALEPGWFGKQWACAAGARVATGSLLLFTDADTWHAPDLMPRAVQAMRARSADLVTIAGRQEMHSFWERVVQPQVFGMLSIRFGGTEHVNGTRKPQDVIANGQFILLDRVAYDAMDGHAAVRDVVAEDLALAQGWVRAGRRIALLLGQRQLSTHMYASLRELVAGWRKNIYAGGRNAAIGGAVGRAIFPAVLMLVPLIGLVPILAFALALAGALSTAWLLWSSVVIVVALAYWAIIYRFMDEPVWYALTYPLGLAVLLYIAAGAIIRGRRVEWKSRQYVSS